MTTSHPTRARRAALSLLAAGAVVGGLLSGPSATAASPDGPTRVTTPLHFKDGRYIVVLREPSATQYAGGRARYAPTRPKSGEQYDSSTDASRAYTDHLERTHRTLARDVGTSVAADYTVALNGFAAQLTGRQAATLSSDRRVALVAPDTARKLDTWASPTFLGLAGKNGSWAKHGGIRGAGAGTVVGDLDSGIWPEAQSFAGRALNSKEKTKWDIHRIGDKVFMDKSDGTRFAGRCMTGEGWDATDCNTKLIAARYYPDIFEQVPEDERSPDEYMSARDGDGHGTHTASTAAGKHGVHAVVEGRDFGKISGMAPAARIAAYKVCFSDNDEETGDCYTSATLAAVDDAVADGVDVINYSISGAVETVIDPVEIAFEGAAEGGVFVATSAGNSGPTAETVAHPSPWVTTVAASTHVAFENTVVLGNGKKYVGASINDTPVPQTPLVDSKSVALAGAEEDAELCLADSLDPAKVTGKIVVCTRGVIARVDKSAEVARAGGTGMILANPSPNSLDADFHSVPTVHVDDKAAAKIWSYIETAGDSATAAFRLGNLTGTETPVPQTAGFSSRGPSLANGGDLLKPDISAPGVSVLAAVAPPTNSGRDFDLYSGTSMASPHIAGLAAFISSKRPHWSPMQIKSAMMTSAKPLFDEKGRPSTDAFAQGAGNVNPRGFFGPGLYITPTNRDFLGFLTGQGLDTGVPAVAARDMNEASIALGQLVGSESVTRQFMAGRKGTWKVTSHIPGVTVQSKKKLVSEHKRDVEDLTFTFTRDTADLGTFSSGFIKLTGPTTVRIPVVMRPVSVKAPQEVSGTGTDGSTPVEITSGFTGELDVQPAGLAEADTASDTVDQGDTHYYCVETTDTTKALRVDLDSVQDDADLDLYGYVMDTDCNSAAVDYLAISATSSADESFTVLDPGAGSFIIAVDGFAAAPDRTSIDYVLDIYDVRSDTGVGGFHADPDPVPVVAGEPTTFDAVWSGLAPDSRYLGLLEYEGALSPTFVTVDTTP